MQNLSLYNVHETMGGRKLPMPNLHSRMQARESGFTGSSRMVVPELVPLKSSGRVRSAGRLQSSSTSNAAPPSMPCRKSSIASGAAQQLGGSSFDRMRRNLQLAQRRDLEESESDYNFDEEELAEILMPPPPRKDNHLSRATSVPTKMDVALELPRRPAESVQRSSWSAQVINSSKLSPEKRASLLAPSKPRRRASNEVDNWRQVQNHHEEDPSGESTFHDCSFDDFEDADGVGGGISILPSSSLMSRAISAPDMLRKPKRKPEAGKYGTQRLLHEIKPERMTSFPPKELAIPDSEHELKARAAPSCPRRKLSGGPSRVPEREVSRASHSFTSNGSIDLSDVFPEDVVEPANPLERSARWHSTPSDMKKMKDTSLNSSSQHTMPSKPCRRGSQTGVTSRQKQEYRESLTSHTASDESRAVTKMNAYQQSMVSIGNLSFGSMTQFGNSTFASIPDASNMASPHVRPSLPHKSNGISAAYGKPRYAATSDSLAVRLQSPQKKHVSGGTALKPQRTNNIFLQGMIKKAMDLGPPPVNTSNVTSKVAHPTGMLSTSAYEVALSRIQKRPETVALDTGDAPIVPIRQSSDELVEMSDEDDTIDGTSLTLRGVDSGNGKTTLRMPTRFDSGEISCLDDGSSVGQEVEAKNTTKMLRREEAFLVGLNDVAPSRRPVTRGDSCLSMDSTIESISSSVQEEMEDIFHTSLENSTRWHSLPSIQDSKMKRVSSSERMPSLPRRNGDIPVRNSTFDGQLDISTSTSSSHTDGSGFYQNRVAASFESSRFAPVRRIKPTRSVGKNMMHDGRKKFGDRTESSSKANFHWTTPSSRDRPSPRSTKWVQPTYEPLSSSSYVSPQRRAQRDGSLLSLLKAGQDKKGHDTGKRKPALTVLYS